MKPATKSCAPAWKSWFRSWKISSLLLAAEENRRPLPGLRERATALRSTLTGLEEALTRGDYPALETGLVAGASRPQRP